MKTVNTQLQASTTSVTSTQASTYTAKVDQIRTIDITAVITGSSPVGSIKIQKNNNPPEVTAVWVDLTNAEVLSGTNSVSISGAATINWALNACGARELRAYITRTSGTITADIRLHGKES